MSDYVGRFAPSPTGLLHAGSLVAALASWLDARAHGGRWLVRIEDLDTPRNVAGAGPALLAQLARCGLHADAPPLLQSTRGALYADAIRQLGARGAVYDCGCTRRDIALRRPVRPARGAAGGDGGADDGDGSHSAASVDGDGDGDGDGGSELVYDGACRNGLSGRPARSLRFRADGTAPVVWRDRRLGQQRQDVAADVGDFVLLRADGVVAYQLAVVVDDAAQGVSDVVRGEDLASNTARQILLQRALGVPTPRYLHVPLVRAADGKKLSKQNGATAIDTERPLDALNSAAAVLGIAARGTTVASFLADATARWRDVWPR